MAPLIWQRNSLGAEGRMGVAGVEGGEVGPHHLVAWLTSTAQGENVPAEITFPELAPICCCNEVAAPAPPKQRDILDEAGLHCDSCAARPVDVATRLPFSS